MKRNIIHPDIENLKIKSIDMECHRVHLRRSLLNSPHWDKTNTFLFWKGGEKIMLKRLVLSGLVVAILVLGVFAFFNSKLGSSTVYAKELAQKTYQTISALPAERQEQLKDTVGMDSRTILQEALHAKDLKVFSYDDFVKSEQLPSDPSGKLKTLKFLRFTKMNGQVVTLGIDPTTNLPVFGSVGYGNPNPPIGEQRTKDKEGFHISSGDDKGFTNCTVMDGKEICTNTTK